MQVRVPSVVSWLQELIDFCKSSSLYILTVEQRVTSREGNVLVKMLVVLTISFVVPICYVQYFV